MQRRRVPMSSRSVRLAGIWWRNSKRYVWRYNQRDVMVKFWVHLVIPKACYSEGSLFRIQYKGLLIPNLYPNPNRKFLQNNEMSPKFYPCYPETNSNIPISLRSISVRKLYGSSLHEIFLELQINLSLVCLLAIYSVTGNSPPILWQEIHHLSRQHLKGPWSWTQWRSTAHVR